MFTISIGKAETNCPDKITLTSGMVKAVQVAFNFSDEWEGFIKTAIFSNGSTTTDVPLDKEDKCYIPHEVLAVPGEEVTVGVYGCKGEGEDYVAIPTEKQSLGEVIEGVDPSGEEPKEPTPTAWDELKIKVENMYSNEEINALFAKKDHTHELAGYEKGVHISLDGITTWTKPDNVILEKTDNLDTLVTDGVDYITIDYHGEAYFFITGVTNGSPRAYWVKIDGVQVAGPSDFAEFIWEGRIEQGIEICIPGRSTLTVRRFRGTKYTNGFMSGEQLEKLENTPTTEEVNNLIAEAFGNVEAVFDEVHEYAESLGGDEA